MTSYGVGLFVHIIAAMVLVGASLLSPLLAAAVRRAGTVGSLREWAGYTRAVSAIAGPAAVTTLLAGIYLAFRGDWWGSGWLEVSLVLFVIAGAIANAVLDPWAKQLAAAADAAADGPVPADLERQRRDRRTAVSEPMLLATDVGIVFLMSAKPGVVGSLVVVAVCWVLGGLLAAREVRHDRGALAGAAA